jgi:hypothetical protein
LRLYQKIVRSEVVGNVERRKKFGRVGSCEGRGKYLNTYGLG